jgi:hypothetical protein
VKPFFGREKPNFSNLITSLELYLSSPLTLSLYTTSLPKPSARSPNSEWCWRESPESVRRLSVDDLKFCTKKTNDGYMTL